MNEYLSVEELRRLKDEALWHVDDEFLKGHWLMKRSWAIARLRSEARLSHSSAASEEQRAAAMRDRATRYEAAAEALEEG